MKLQQDQHRKWLSILNAHCQILSFLVSEDKYGHGGWNKGKIYYFFLCSWNNWNQWRRLWNGRNSTASKQEACLYSPLRVVTAMEQDKIVIVWTAWLCSIFILFLRLIVVQFNTFYVPFLPPNLHILSCSLSSLWPHFH